MWNTHHARAHALTEPSTAEMVGCIVDNPIQEQRYTRFLWETDEGRYQFKVYSEPKTLWPGDCFRANFKRKPVHYYLNPGVKDARFYAYHRGIIGRAHTKGPVEILSHKSTLARWRAKWRALLLERYSASPYKGLILGLGLGDKSKIDNEMRTTFRRTGTSHLLAISGLHLSMVAAFCAVLFRLLGRLSLGLIHLQTAQRWGQWGAALCVLGYAFLAGFSVSTQRALIMVYAVWFLGVTGRARPGQALGLALVFVLLWDPYSLFFAGTYLSFMAVACLSFCFHSTSGGGAWRQTLQTQGRITVALLPVSLYCFGQIPYVGFIANIMAIPWVSFIVLPAVMLALFVSPWAALPLDYVFIPLSLFLNALSGLSWASAYWPQPPLWAVGVASLGVVIFCLPKSFSGRYVGLVLFLPLFFWAKPRPEKGHMWVDVLDVGQGLSVVVQTHGHTLVYDTGPGHVDGWNAGDQVLRPYLLHHGTTTVDLLVISHADNDHSGGALALIRDLKVLDVHSSDQTVVSWAKDCHRQPSWHWDGVAFQYFSLSEVKGGRRRKNNRSCVLAVSNEYGSVLLPGDIEASSEAYLVKHYGKALNAEVLIAPHHGSKTSSTQGFVEAVSPRQVVFSIGRWNHYHFPHPDIVQRYRALGVDMEDSAENGLLRITL